MHNSNWGRGKKGAKPKAKGKRKRKNDSSSEDEWYVFIHLFTFAIKKIKEFRFWTEMLHRFTFCHSNLN